MSTTGVGTRIATFLLALLFLASSAGVSIGIFYLVRREQNQSEKNIASTELQQAIEDAQNGTLPTPTPASGDTAQTNQGEQPVQPQNKLEGTKLANYTPGGAVSELQVVDLVVGTGAEAKADSTVTAHYTGALVADGTIFQSSKDTGNPFTSSLGRLIQGWQEGIPGMKAGGTRRLIIPAAKAYGSQSQPGIPANSDLVFDIELISVQ